MTLPILPILPKPHYKRVLPRENWFRFSTPSLSFEPGEHREDLKYTPPSENRIMT